MPRTLRSVKISPAALAAYLNNTMHAEPPIACFQWNDHTGGPVIVDVMQLISMPSQNEEIARLNSEQQLLRLDLDWEQRQRELRWFLGSELSRTHVLGGFVGGMWLAVWGLVWAVPAVFAGAVVIALPGIALLAFGIGMPTIAWRRYSTFLSAEREYQTARAELLGHLTSHSSRVDSSGDG